MAEEAENKEVKFSEDGMLNEFFKSHYTEEEIKELAEQQSAIVPEDNSETKTQDQIDADKKVADEQKTKDEAAAKAEEARIQDAVNKAIEAQTQGKFKSVADLASISDYKEPEFVNPESKAIYEALLSDKKDVVLEYLQKSSADYSKITDIDILKAKYKSEHPYVSDQDAEEEIKDQYNLDLKISDTDKDLLSPEAYEEKEKKIARAQRVAKRDAEEFRNKLIAEKPVLEIPKPIEKVAPVDEAAEQEANGAKIWFGYTEEGASSLPDSINHNLSLEIGDGEDKVSFSTEYKIEGEDKKALADYVRTFIPAAGRELDYVKDDKVDVQRIITEGIDKLFSKKMYTALLKESVAKVKKGLIEDIKNIDDTPNALTPKPEMTEEEFRAKAISY